LTSLELIWRELGQILPHSGETDQT
jgi:hypothetical protein